MHLCMTFAALKKLSLAPASAVHTDRSCSNVGFHVNEVRRVAGAFGVPSRSTP